jgi:uncharacterized protein YgiM (DUF1202 family)
MRRITLLSLLVTVLAASMLGAAPSRSYAKSLTSIGSKAPIAHRSGCHRWHTCPSDSGSYTCGDAGHPCQYPTYPSSSSSNSSNSSSSNNSSSSKSTSYASRSLAYVNTNQLNLRAGPGTQYKLLGSYGKAKLLWVLEKSPDKKWSKVETTGDVQSGWMLSEYLTEQYPGSDPTTASTQLAMVNTDVLNLRSGPGKQYSIIGKYTNGRLFEVLSKSADGKWLKVKVVADSKIGWVMAEYIRVF